MSEAADFDPKDLEIARLRWWLEHIYRSRNAISVDLREMALNALDGDMPGPPHPPPLVADR